MLGIKTLADIDERLESTNELLFQVRNLLVKVLNELAAQRDTQPLGVSDEGAAWAMEADNAD